MGNFGRLPELAQRAKWSWVQTPMRPNLGSISNLGHLAARADAMDSANGTINLIWFHMHIYSWAPSAQFTVAKRFFS